MPHYSPIKEPGQVEQNGTKNGKKKKKNGVKNGLILEITLKNSLDTNLDDLDQILKEVELETQNSRNKKNDEGINCLK